MMRIIHRQSPNLLALALCLAVTAGCTKAHQVRSLLSDAQRDFDAKRYDVAELEYQKVLILSRLHPVAVRQLGLLYYEEGRREASMYLKKSLDQDPNNLQVHLKLADLNGAAGKIPDALKLLEPVLLKDPANDEGLWLLAQLTRVNDLPALRQRLEAQTRAGGKGVAPCYSAMGLVDLREQKFSQAEADFQKALSLDPKLSSPHLGLANLSSARKDPKGTENDLKMAADLSPIRSPARLKYIDFKIRSGRADEAIKMLREMTRQAPDYMPAWTHLMRLTFAERKYSECKSVIDTILARDSNNYEALLQSADLALTQRDGPKAQDVLERMEGMYKTSPEVKYQLALACLANRETAKATARLNDALKLDRNYTPAVLLLAELDIRASNPRDAVSLLLQLIKDEPTNGRAYLLLAQARLAQQQLQEAVEVYRQMAEIFPKNPEVPLLAGMVYEMAGDLAHERVALERSLALAPAYLPALEKITDLDIRQRLFTDAHRRVAGVMEKNPEAPGPLVLEGEIYLAEGKTNQAESALNKVIDLKPEVPLPYLMLARIYMASHQEQQALERLATLVSKTNDISAMRIMGEIHQAAGQYDAARDAFEKLLAVYPKYIPALNDLAYLYAEHLGHPDKALELAEQARSLSPTDPNTADTLGWILFKQHDYVRALTLIQESAEKQPGEAEVQMHLGMTDYMLQAENPARLALQQAVASGADFPDKELARRSLANLNVDPATATPAMIEELEKQSRQNPRDPVVLMRLAAIEERRGNIEKAVSNYKTLIENNSQDVSAMIQLAGLYYNRLHDTREALKLANSAHKLAPDNPQAAMLLGEMTYQSGQYPLALSLLEQAATQLTNQPSVQYHLALAYYSVGRVAEADAAMQQAARSDQSFPNLDQAKQFLALRAAATNPDQARASAALVQKTLQKEPNDVPALMVSELLDETRGAYKEAGQTCEKVLAVYPLFVPAMRQLAILDCQHSGDQARAYDLGVKAIALLPKDIELAKTLGILAYRRHDYNGSMIWLRESADKYSGDGEALGCLGMDYFHLNQRLESKPFLQRALALTNIPAPLAIEARRALAELK